MYFHFPRICTCILIVSIFVLSFLFCGYDFLPEGINGLFEVLFPSLCVPKGSFHVEAFLKCLLLFVCVTLESNTQDGRLENCVLRSRHCCLDVTVGEASGCRSWQMALSGPEGPWRNSATLLHVRSAPGSQPSQTIRRGWALTLTRQTFPIVVSSFCSWLFSTVTTSHGWLF